MRTCERHKRAVVVYEVGLAECPFCALVDKTAGHAGQMSDLQDRIEELEDAAAAEEKA